jgi:hypothetical protein
MQTSSCPSQPRPDKARGQSRITKEAQEERRAREEKRQEDVAAFKIQVYHNPWIHVLTIQVFWRRRRDANVAKEELRQVWDESFLGDDQINRRKHRSKLLEHYCSFTTLVLIRGELFSCCFDGWCAQRIRSRNTGTLKVRTFLGC